MTASTTETGAPVRVVFLAGIGRSGSTLLERMVGETPGATSLGEVLHLNHRGLVQHELCACRQPFLECPFWRKVGHIAFGGWDQVDRARIANLRADVDRALRVPQIALGHPRRLEAKVLEYVDFYVRIYRAAHEITGDVLVDSSKQVSLAWCLSRSPDIDLRLVHCVRDSRGVAYSWSKQVVRPEAVSDVHRYMTRYSPARISAYWLLHNLEAGVLARRVPSLRVRYEDLIDAPVATTAAVLRMAGIEASATHVSASAVELGPTHSCAGNPMRFRTGTIELANDDGWVTAQSGRDRRIVTALTAPLLAGYGYPLHRTT